MTPQYQREFPDFVLDVPVPDHWADSSWHNDVCPSWIIREGAPGLAGVAVFIDYADPALRELPGPRFNVVVGEPAEALTLLATDQWAAVLMLDTALWLGQSLDGEATP